MQSSMANVVAGPGIGPGSQGYEPQLKTTSPAVNRYGVVSMTMAEQLISSTWVM